MMYMFEIDFGWQEKWVFVPDKLSVGIGSNTFFNFSMPFFDKLLFAVFATSTSKVYGDLLDPRRIVSSFLIKKTFSTATQALSMKEPVTSANAPVKLEARPSKRSRICAMTTNSVMHFDNHKDFVVSLEGIKGDPLVDSGGRIVVYRGSPSANLMVIGEAPGETEDLLGKPFVGKAGQLLDQILASVSFDVEKDVYVSNIVRRRPPNNRNPTTQEVAFFKPWLMEEIRLVDPRIILLAGSYSTKAILEEEKRGITKIRGLWYERKIGDEGGLDGQGLRLCMPIFHPSYLLRNPSKTPGSPKALMWNDIRMIRKKYDELCL